MRYIVTTVSSSIFSPPGYKLQGLRGDVDIDNLITNRARTPFF